MAATDGSDLVLLMVLGVTVVLITLRLFARSTR
jgi:hypothetical protein